MATPRIETFVQNGRVIELNHATGQMRELGTIATNTGWGSGGTGKQGANTLQGGGGQGQVNMVGNTSAPPKNTGGGTGANPLLSSLNTAAINNLANKAITNPTPASSSSSSSKNKTAASTTPYMDATNGLIEQLKSGYASQLESLSAREKEYLDKIEGDYQNWLTGINQQHNDFLERMQGNEERAQKQSNASYDQAATQNYIKYMQAQKQLPSQLHSLGIRGGAAESSLIRLGSNYGTNVANNEMARAQALDSIRQQYADIIADAEAELKKAILARDDTKANQIATYLDNANREAAEITAAMNDAVNSAYSTALMNDIEYKQRMEEIEREEKRYQDEMAYKKAQDKLAEEHYVQEWKASRSDKALQDFISSTENLSEKSLRNLLKKVQASKDANKETKINYLKGLLNLRSQQNSGGGGGSRRSGGGGYSPSGTTSTPSTSTSNTTTVSDILTDIALNASKKGSSTTKKKNSGSPNR